MNLNAITYYLGCILRLEACLMLPSLMIGLYRGERSSAVSFLVAIILAVLISFITVISKKKDLSISHREGFVIVSLCWIVMSLIGSIPFCLSGHIPNYLDAFFEVVSGFTTTGASILQDVEALSYSLLFWRSFTHWMGGMGILVFVLAIIPMTKGKGDSMHVLKAESPGPTVGKLAPTMRRSARLLYSIYVVMTLILVVLLLLGGMPLYDSVVNALATAGTGGFAIKSASIAAYDSYYLQGVLAVFMILFGINFNLYYLILIRRAGQIWKSEELRLYLGIIVFSTITIAVNVRGLFTSLFDAFHHSFFQVASIITTTGFATADFDLWPNYSRCLLVVLMLVGGCAGSTGGGIKVSRLLILWKSLRGNIQKLLFPRSVKVLKMDGKPVEDDTIQGTLNYMVIYSLIAIISVLLLAALDNSNFETSFTAVLACLNNIGPGLGAVGPTCNFSFFSPLSKLILCVNMLLGRLEIYPMILLFAPSVWRKRSIRSK